MNDYRNVVLTTEVEVCDPETGELRKCFVEDKRVRVSKEEDFAKFYFEGVRFTEDMTPSMWRLFFVMMRRMDYDGCVYAVGPDRESLMAEVGIKSPIVFNRALLGLKEKGVIQHRVHASGTKARGFYRLNPYIVARGGWQHVKELRRVYCLEMEAMRNKEMYEQRRKELKEEAEAKREADDKVS